ncbi:MAG: TonB-dependent receptor, partial [Melioribacteraceae bacterium]
MKVKIFILAAILSGSVSAQNSSIHGKITDSASGSPIQGAVIYISRNQIAHSNHDGNYSIKNISPGMYTIKISRIGYRSVSAEFTADKLSGEKNFALIPAPIELDEVLVNTDRMEKYLRNSPFSALLLGSDEIENKPAQSLSDLLKDQPGLSLLRDGVWGTEISIRGLNRENVVALIDGSRIATATDVAARLSMIDLNDVERIEVIKGAASSIYGSGATGGIVNVITKSPQTYDHFMMNGNLSAGINSVNNLTALSGSLYGGSSFWSSKISGSYRKAGNTQTPSGELYNSQFKDYSFSGALNIIPAENNLIKFNYQLFKAENVGIPGASVFPENAEVRYPDEKREMISAGYEIQNISTLVNKISAKYSYQYIARNVENIPHQVQNIPASGTAPARRVSVLKITPEADHKNNNLQIQTNLSPTGNNNLILGIDYWDRSYRGERNKYQMIEVLNSQGNVTGVTNKTIGE